MNIIAKRKNGIKGRPERFIQCVCAYEGTYAGTFGGMKGYIPSLKNVKIVNPRGLKDITYKYDVRVENNSEHLTKEG